MFVCVFIYSLLYLLCYNFTSLEFCQICKLDLQLNFLPPFGQPMEIFGGYLASRICCGGFVSSEFSQYFVCEIEAREATEHGYDDFVACCI